MQAIEEDQINEKLKEVYECELSVDIRFTKKEQIGEGAFGSVHPGKNMKTGEHLAIKIEKKNDGYTQISQEYKIYKVLESKQMPYGHVMVMQQFGENLEKLMKKYSKFSRYTTSTIGMQMLDRLHSLHSCNYVYRDVKPDNFLLGKEERDKIFLIDFGLSKRFRDPNTGLHIPYRDGKNLTGTARYASINTHLGMEQSRRDDIEALSYLLIFFLKGSLPWQNMPGRNFKEKSKKIGAKKMETKISDLCAGCPKEMEKFVQHARNLKYDERPNYEFLGKLLSSIRERELKENKDDCILDWEMQLQINGK